MHRASSLVPLLLAVVATAAGCTYLRNRGRDAADIFTASVGLGAGAKARVGPLNLGLIWTADHGGLRAGDFGLSRRPGEEIQVLVAGTERMNDALPIYARSKYYYAANGIFGVADYSDENNRPIYFGSYYTQVEVIVAVGGSLRLGVNPGELLDFLLGWTTLDIFFDDLTEEEERPLREATPPDKKDPDGKPVVPFTKDPFGL